ncbi:hypothetical protein BH11PSE11_BH11PSE11_15800 [soil metagenome]
MNLVKMQNVFAAIRQARLLRSLAFLVAMSVASISTAVQAASPDAPASVPKSLFVPSTAAAARDAAVATERQIVRSQTVAIKLPLLTGPIDGTAGDSRSHPPILLNLFDDVSFVAEPTQVSHTAKGVTWLGKLRGVDLSSVVIVVSGDVVSGNISSPQGRYHIRYVGNGLHEVQKIDQSKFPEDETHVPVPEPGAGGDAYQRDPSAASDDGTTIDVMVIYSATTRAAAGGTSAIESQINLAIAETNQAYLNSGVTQRVRLVHAAEAAYTEAVSNPLLAALNCITSTSDGCLDNVHALRNTYGADLVSFWIEGDHSSCGVAWLMTSVSTAFSGNGFSAVERSCATGYYSFGHELGHNMGLNHDTYVAAGTLPYAYAHGYTNAAAASPWRTIMAYNDACTAVGKNCTRIQYFSNPGILFGGAAMGTVASSDNHLALNNTAFAVANFRASIASTCTYALGASGVSFGMAATTGSVSVTVATGCGWTAVSNAGWITVTSGATGSGNGSVGFSVAANYSGVARSGTITIGGLTYTVNQSASKGLTPTYYLLLN